MDAEYWSLRQQITKPTARTGIVRPSGAKGVCDNNGRFHPVGNTFFWAMQGSHNIDERSKLIKTLDFLMEELKPDYNRILGEVAWPGRDIDPNWSDWKETLAWFMDRAYERGMRTQITAVGDRGEFAKQVIEQATEVVKDKREHMLFSGEVCNEWFQGNPDKLTLEELTACAKLWKQLLPDHLIGLSAPKPKSSQESENSNIGVAAMKEATKAANCNIFYQHPRRTKMEYGWDNVSQAYDFRTFDFISSNGEPVGPQSSGTSEMRPLFLAAMRALTHICNGACYVFHAGQMVTGKADANHGRPEYLWDVPGIKEMHRAVRAVDAILPEDIEDWKVRNNGRDHPMRQPNAAFWSDENYPHGWINKNYSAVTERGFIVMPMGVRGSMAPMGQLQRRSKIRAYDLKTSKQVMEIPELQVGQTFGLPGASNTEAAYVVIGDYL